MKRSRLVGAAVGAFIGCTLMVSSPGTSKAADISYKYDYRLYIYLTGEIERGDLKEIVRVYEAVEAGDIQRETRPRSSIIPDEDGFIWLPREEALQLKAQIEEAKRKGEAPPKWPPKRPLTVIVNSVGGSVDEAMRIGRWLRQNGSSVLVPEPSACASACVFILAAGLNKSVWGDVIIHRPYFSEMPAGGIGDHLQDLLRETRAYLAEMNIPESLADDMFSIRPEDGVVLSSDALTRYRLNTADIVFQEKADLRRAEQLGISRFELIRRRQALQHAFDLGACEDIEDLSELGDCIDALYRLHGLSTR
jgi:hypothetical protein